MSAGHLAFAESDATDDWLERGRRAGLLSALDVQFARRIAALYDDLRPEVLRALALACRQESLGHVCADLTRLAGGPLVADTPGDAAALPVLPEEMALEDWIEALVGSPLVGAPTDREDATGSEAPLVLDRRGRLYLRRGWEDQASLARHLRERGARSDLAVPAVRPGEADDGGLADTDGEVDWSSVALGIGLARPLTVVTGGPGTGKTTLVARLVAAIVAEAERMGRALPVVRLLAPTGKAAAALSASFGREWDRLESTEAVRRALSVKAETIQRALHAGLRRDALGRPRRDALEADLVVVDEASMVDLALMARLFEACERVDRVVLLGDPDQLASVEAGAVLAELCRGVDPAAAPVDFAARADSVEASSRPALRDSFVTLRKSHRFEAGGAIASLAEAIRHGDADRALEVLADSACPEVELAESGSIEATRERLVREARRMQQAIRAAEDGEAKLACLGSHRVLCALRRGPLGVDVLAPLLDEAAAAERRTTAAGDWWPGRMVLVTRNAPEQDLWNGDVGLIEESALGLRAFFPGTAGGVRSFSASRLPEHESAMAMSVHKSQGSEFDVVDLVVGSVASRLMTRELLYTGVTRARQSLRIHASEAVVRGAIASRVERASGLGDLLWATED